MARIKSAVGRKSRFLHEWRIVIVVTVMMVITLSTSFYLLSRNVNQFIAESRQLAQNQVSDVAQQVSTLYSNYSKMCDILATKSEIQKFAGHTADVPSDYLVRQGVELQKDLFSLFNIYGEDITTLAVFFPSSHSIVTMSRFLDNPTTDYFFQSHEEISPAYLEQLPFGSIGNAMVLNGNNRSWLVRKFQTSDMDCGYILVEYNISSFVNRLTKDMEDPVVFVGDNAHCLFSSGSTVTDEEYLDILSEASQSNSFLLKGENHIAQFSTTRVENVNIVSGIPDGRLVRIQSACNVIIILAAVSVLAGIVILLWNLKRNLILPLENLIHTSRREGLHTQDILYNIANDLVEIESNRNRLLKERDYLLPLTLGLTMNRVKEVSPEQAANYAESCLSLAQIPADTGFAMFSIVCEDKDTFFNELRMDNAAQDGLHYFIENVLSDLLFQNFPGIVAPIGNNRYAVLVSCPEQADIGQIEEAKKRLISFYSETFSVYLSASDVQWGVGTADFTTATFALFRTVMFHNFTVDDANLNVDVSFSYYSNLIRKLINSLNVQNFDSISAKLDPILRHAISADSQNFHVTNHRIYAITALIITAIEEQFSGNPEFIKQLRLEERLYDITSMSQYEAELKDILSQVVIRKDAAERNQSIYYKMEKIRQYLLAHYMDNSISVASVAQQFDISISYLSRMFKETYHINLLEYIHRLRVESAKDLLANDSIQNVAQKVGFWDTQGLNRAFKKQEGISPGDYKRMLEKK